MHDICSHSEVITLKILSNTRTLRGVFLEAKLLNELVCPSLVTHSVIGLTFCLNFVENSTIELCKENFTEYIYNRFLFLPYPYRF